MAERFDQITALIDAKHEVVRKLDSFFSEEVDAFQTAATNMTQIDRGRTAQVLAGALQGLVQECSAEDREAHPILDQIAQAFAQLDPGAYVENPSQEPQSKAEMETGEEALQEDAA